MMRVLRTSWPLGGSYADGRRWWLGIAGAASLMLVLSCGASQTPLVVEHRLGTGPGFWLGLWQGFIAPIDFVVGLFSHHIRIYSVPNAGRWYDLGFMLGIGGFHGGLFASRRRQTGRISVAE